MYRKLQNTLENWIVKENRKPLIIRGARQVGKSTLVRQTITGLKRPLMEINCEQHPQLESVFKTLNIQKIMDELESLPGKKSIGPSTVLFFDEVQATPSALAALRYFFEERPDIPVICAGSLLEFALSEHDFSMPVGRIEFLQLVPMDFEEFLLACDEKKLFDVLQNFTPTRPMSSDQHERLLELQQHYCFIGGMPEAVREYASKRKLSVAREVHDSILETYKSDFSKYGLKQDLLRLTRLLDQVAQQVTKRTKFSRLIAEEQSRTVRRLLDLLIQARLLSTILHSDANDIPLGAGARPDIFKLLLIDVGLLNALIGLSWNTIKSGDSIMAIRDGAIAEQFVGQELIATMGKGKQQLHYWLREGKTTNAEIDFVVALDGKIIPIEVKAGKSGTLRSLTAFCSLRQPEYALRFDANLPSFQNFSWVDVNSQNHSCKLISLPLYAVSQIERLYQDFESS